MLFSSFFSCPLRCPNPPRNTFSSMIPHKIRFYCIFFFLSLSDGLDCGKLFDSFATENFIVRIVTNNNSEGILKPSQWSSYCVCRRGVQNWLQYLKVVHQKLEQKHVILYSFTWRFVYQSVNPFILWSINLSIEPLTIQSCIYPNLRMSIHQDICPPSIYPSINLSIHQNTYPIQILTYLPIHIPNFTRI